MCMTCGCGELDKRRQPTDITREDVQRAADGAGLSLRQAANHLARSLRDLNATNGEHGSKARWGRWSTARRA